MEVAKPINYVVQAAATSLESLLRLAEVAFCTPPGLFIECGVWKGGSSIVFNEICKEQGRELWLFDTFEGFPEYTPEVDKFVVGGPEFRDTSFEAVRKMLPGPKIFKGKFPDTLPQDIPPIAFVYGDFDQYISTLEICQKLSPYMVCGGVMVFDDMDLGCGKAVREFFPSERIELLNGAHWMVRF